MKTSVKWLIGPNAALGAGTLTRSFICPHQSGAMYQFVDDRANFAARFRLYDIGSAAFTLGLVIYCAGLIFLAVRAYRRRETVPGKRLLLCFAAQLVRRRRIA